MGKVYPIKHATKKSIYREALRKSWNPTARPKGGAQKIAQSETFNFAFKVLFGTHSLSVSRKNVRSENCTFSRCGVVRDTLAECVPKN